MGYFAARRMIRKFYGKHIPILFGGIKAIEYGEISPNVVYELSVDEFLGEKGYGLTIVWRDSEGKLHDSKFSNYFPSLETAKEYIRWLRGQIDEICQTKNEWANKKGPDLKWKEIIFKYSGGREGSFKLFAEYFPQSPEDMKEYREIYGDNNKEVK